MSLKITRFRCVWLLGWIFCTVGCSPFAVFNDIKDPFPKYQSAQPPPIQSYTHKRLNEQPVKYAFKRLSANHYHYIIDHGKGPYLYYARSEKTFKVTLNCDTQAEGTAIITLFYYSNEYLKKENEVKDWADYYASRIAVRIATLLARRKSKINKALQESKLNAPTNNEGNAKPLAYCNPASQHTSSTITLGQLDYPNIKQWASLNWDNHFSFNSTTLKTHTRFKFKTPRFGKPYSYWGELKLDSELAHKRFTVSQDANIRLPWFGAEQAKSHGKVNVLYDLSDLQPIVDQAAVAFSGSGTLWSDDCETAWQASVKFAEMDNAQAFWSSLWRFANGACIESKHQGGVLLKGEVPIAVSYSHTYDWQNRRDCLSQLSFWTAEPDSALVPAFKSGVMLQLGYQHLAQELNLLLKARDGPYTLAFNGLYNVPFGTIQTGCSASYEVFKDNQLGLQYGYDGTLGAHSIRLIYDIEPQVLARFFKR